MLLFCAKFVRACRITDAAAAGLVCGLAVMTRPIAQFLPIALAIAAPMIVLYHGRGWRRASASALVVILLAAPPVAPLIARNISLFGSAKLTTQAAPPLLSWVVGHARPMASGQEWKRGVWGKSGSEGGK